MHHGPCAQVSTLGPSPSPSQLISFLLGQAQPGSSNTSTYSSIRVRTPSLQQRTPKLTAMFRSIVCADDGSSCDIPVPLSLYKPRHRQSPFPSTRTSSHRRVIAALPLGSSKLPSPPPLPVHRRDAATAASHPYRTLFLVTGPTEGTAAARRRLLLPFQEVPSSSSARPAISPRRRSSPQCPR